MLLQIQPLAAPQSLQPVSSQVLQLSAASSTAEQSLLAHGLSSVYDPSQQEDATSAGGPETRLTLQASPSDATDTRYIQCKVPVYASCVCVTCVCPGTMSHSWDILDWALALPSNPSQIVTVDVHPSRSLQLV